MNKLKTVYFLTVFIFSLSLLIPNSFIEPDMDFHRLSKKYEWLKPAWFNAIAYYCSTIHVSVDDVCAIINSESNGNSTAVSCAGARGLMQIMPFHAKSYGVTVKDLFNPYINLYIGIHYWKKCMTFAKGNRKRAIMAYNAGPGFPPSQYTNWKYLKTICKNSNFTKTIDNSAVYRIY